MMDEQVNQASFQALETGRKPVFAFARVQIALLILTQFLAIYIYLAVSAWQNPYNPILMSSTQFQGSVFWCAIANVISYFILRQLIAYPGTSHVVYFIPSLLMSYALIAGLILISRFDYYRSILLCSFIAALLWLHIDYYVRVRHTRQRLGVVPGGLHRNLFNLHGVEWFHFREPGDSVVGLEGVVADLHYDHPTQWERFIAQCVVTGIPVYNVKNVIESLTGRVDVEHLSENGFGSVLPSSMYLRAKRALDFVLALLVLPVFAVIIAGAAVLIKLEGPGPVFFTQARMGYRARPFTIYKLRSMSMEAASGQLFTGEDDPRITRIGRVLRKYRIDELPQVLNILNGDMSWIGPRPEAIKLSEWYASDIPYYIYRHAVRPGLSGWAQVNQGNVAEIDAATIKLQYDFYYIKHFSPWLDLLILIRTIRTILTGFGSK